MTDRFEPSALTRGFIAHDIDAAAFHHREHIVVAWELLRMHDFIDAAAIYARGIRTIADAAGAHEKFNLTITYAFMSLIAERMSGGPDNADAFIAAHPELMRKDLLARWYGAERLDSPEAKTVFLMPEVA